MKLAGKTVEELEASKVLKAKQKEEEKVSYNKLFRDLEREFHKSINFLIFTGYHSIWEEDYLYYKRALEDLKEYEKLQILQFSTAIGLVFGGDKAINDFFNEDQTGGKQIRNKNHRKRRPKKRVGKRKKGFR